MTALSNYAENALLDHVFGGAAWTAPANTYVKLHTGDPGEDCAGNPAAETTRKVLSWAAASGLSIATNAAVSWDPYGAAEAVSHYSIWDDLTAGNPLAYGALDQTFNLNNGDQFSINSGDLSISLDGALLVTAIATAMLDHMTGRAAFAQPAGLFIKAHLGDPGTAATANPAAETTRIAATMAAASGGAKASSADITWTGVSTSETWSHFSLWSAVTAGTALGRFAADTPKAVTATEDAVFTSGSLVLNAA